MKNDLPPAWLFEISLTINCESTWPGLSIENLVNVSVIGQRISTVNCSLTGAISFSSCNNVTIKSINGENCGSSNESSYPVISFYQSSNLNIHNCSFSSSTGQAVLFSEASGNVYISNSVFTHS